MKMRKDSWHYKLNSSDTWTFGFISGEMYMNDKYSGKISLCVYFWLTVFSCMFAVIRALSLAVAGLLILFAVWMFVLAPWLMYIDIISLLFTDDVIFGFTKTSELVTINFILLAIHAFLAFQLCKENGMEWWPSYLKWVPALFRKESSPKKQKQPSLLKAYIKAKKDKVCPLIEFED